MMSITTLTPEVTRTAYSSWKNLIADLGPRFAALAAAHDQNDAFVAQNFADLKHHRFFSAMIPQELGGGGLHYQEMSLLIREIARYCGSTALTFAMHQHLVAAAIWNHRQGKPGEKLLRSVVNGERILVSTGATDWLSSNGTLQPVDGGFRFSARKTFASGCLAGDLLVTSGQYDDAVDGAQVLHFALPLKAEGVRIEESWKAMGMRGTGSHDVVIENAFVPAESIGLRRPRGVYHPVWNVVLTVALPLICSAYVGVAEAAEQIAREGLQKKDDGIASILMGELENELTTAQIGLDSMVALVDNFDFKSEIETTDRILIRKTIVTQAVLRTAEKALEVTRGKGYFRSLGLERLLRDAHAGQFHPMQPKKQCQFSGRLAMGLEPIPVENASAS